MARLAIATCWFLGALVAIQGVAAAATIDVDTVLGPDHPYQDQTITVIDGANPPTNVTILEGAVIGDLPGEPVLTVGLDVYGSSNVHMLGGGISGSPHNVLLHDESVFRMQGGEVELVEATDASRVVLNGGFWARVEGYDSSRLEVNGGVNASFFSVRTFGESHAVVAGADLDLIADEQSTVVIRGGEFERAQATGEAQMLVTGGRFIVGIGATGNGVVRVRGVDSFADDEPLYVFDQGIIHVYGTGLRFGIDPFTDQPSVLGTLADGDPFSGQYRIFDQGQIILHEVPEPGAVGLLGMGAAALFCRRRAHFVATRRYHK